MSKISKEELNPQLKSEIERIPTQETLDNFTFALMGLGEDVEALKTRPSSEPLYAECSTGPSAESKEITLPRMPEVGDIITVRFRWNNTASRPKLSISSTAQSLTGNITHTFAALLTWAEMQTITFVYTGVTFEIPANNVYATKTNAGVVKVDGSSIVINPTSGVISAPKVETTPSYAVCTDASTSANKNVTVPGFKAVAGSPITIKFTQPNTINPTLNIDSSDPVTGMMSSVMGTVSTRGVLGATWKAGDVVTFIYANNAFEVETNGAPSRAEFDSLFNEVTDWDAVCSSASTSRYKDITLPGFEPKDGVTVRVKFTQPNTTSNPTLSIDASDPETGMINTLSVVISTRGVMGATWLANDIITFVYYNTSFEVLTNGGVTRQEFNSLFNSVSNGKTAVANAITQKGITTSTTAEFATMAANIANIQTGNVILSGTGNATLSGTTDTDFIVNWFDGGDEYPKLITIESTAEHGMVYHWVRDLHADALPFNGAKAVANVVNSTTQQKQWSSFMSIMNANSTSSFSLKVSSPLLVGPFRWRVIQ